MKGIQLLSIVIWIGTISALFNDYGVVLPHDPYVFIGSELQLTCNLTNSHLRDTSESLFFTKANNIIEKHYTKVLSSRTILLSYPITNATEDRGSYVCKLNRTSRYEVVGNQFVTVEYAPRKVESISCTVYNWEKMTCSWDLGVQYVNLDNINVNLVWAVRDGRQSDCPHLTINSCTWKKIDGLDSFHPDMLYYMAVIVTNNKTKLSVQSKVFHVYTNKIVQPSSVSDLQTSHNSTCIHLEWEHTKPEYEKTYRIQYKSVWENGQWQELVFSDSYAKTICGLVPSTLYTVKVSCKPHWTRWNGTWSEDKEETIKLDEDVPGAPPDAQPGGFTEKYCSFKNCRVITVYWKPILKRIANGEIINYKLTARETGSLSAVTQDETGINTSGQLVLMANQNYYVEIQGQTSVGLSPHKSSILILAKDQKPPFPSGFIVKARETTSPERFVLDIKWEEPNIHQQIIGYTLFWCNGKSDDLVCLKDSFEWTVLSADKTEYTKEISKSQLQTVMYGISLETKYGDDIVSSGILWNECIYMDNNTPIPPPKNVRVLPLVEDNTMLVEWDKFKCSETREYITQYNVYYCQAREGHNCSESYQVVPVKSYDTSVELTGLLESASYKVWVQAVSDSGPGPSSEAIFTTLPMSDNSLSTEEIAWIVIGCSLLVVFSLIGFIFLFRKCAAEVKEQFRPYDIDLPLPPIPMIRPSSSISKSPDSEDDDIYTKIPELGIPPSPTTPESSQDMPLISYSQASTMKATDRIDSYIKQPNMFRTLPPIAPSPNSLFSRLQLSRNSYIDRESHYQDDKNMSTFRPRPKPSNNLSSGISMNSDVSPYSCVDIVLCPNSEKVQRKILAMEKPNCHSVGSMVDDPTYVTNNLSDLPKNAKKVATYSQSLTMGDSREHFNIPVKSPLDRRKVEDDTALYDRTFDSCASNDLSSVNNDSGNTQDSNPLPDDQVSSYVQEGRLDKISSYIQEGQMNIPENLHTGSSYVKESDFHKSEDLDSVFLPQGGYVRDTWTKCPNNNDYKVVNSYVPTMPYVTEVMPAQGKSGEATYVKELNIKPGPRPVSEVINVPPHFYGSLSLLDTGDATEL